ncbi:hemin receptor [Alphaproteobacteria bacterium HT1-32]|nr:hemin receptor [Alphaproteobacteria bacterium HT1-32]
MPIDAEQVRLVKSSFIRLLPVRDEFSQRLYANLFAAAPDVRVLFPKDLRQQREKLIATLTTVVNNASKLDEIDRGIWSLGRNHIDYGVKDVHYQVLKDVLLKTLAEEFGDDMTPDLTAAWSGIYDELASRMRAG